MKDYFGNCSSLIDWTEVIREIESEIPAYVGPRHEVGDPVPGVDEVVGTLRKAGYLTIPEGGTSGWDMFLPGKNFDERLVDNFSQFVGLDGYTNAWIARILPGYMAPWHWDITDHEETLAKKNFVRYHCHIQEPVDGHMLVIENEFYYKANIGDVYRWPDRKSWHCAANCGYVPFYSFHFWH